MLKKSPEPPSYANFVFLRKLVVPKYLRAQRTQGYSRLVLPTLYEWSRPFGSFKNNKDILMDNKMRSFFFML